MTGRSHDRRLRILEQALADPLLTPSQKVFLVVVTTIKTEYVDGERRHGSKSMGPDGKFTLHLDYLARAMNTSAEGVRKIRRALEAQKFLDEVHAGTFGRPSTYQALTDVRGAKNGRLTSGRNGNPYGLTDWLVRVAEKAPLTYRTPDQRDPAPEPGGSEPEQSESQAAWKTAPVATSSKPAVCRWHPDEPCPADCANAPVPDTNSRRSA